MLKIEISDLQPSMKEIKLFPPDVGGWYLTYGTKPQEPVNVTKKFIGHGEIILNFL